MQGASILNRVEVGVFQKLQKTTLMVRLGWKSSCVHVWTDLLLIRCDYEFQGSPINYLFHSPMLVVFNSFFNLYYKAVALLAGIMWIYSLFKQSNYENYFWIFLHFFLPPDVDSVAAFFHATSAECRWVYQRLQLKTSRRAFFGPSKQGCQVNRTSRGIFHALQIRWIRKAEIISSPHMHHLFRRIRADVGVAVTLGTAQTAPRSDSHRPSDCSSSLTWAKKRANGS